MKKKLKVYPTQSSSGTLADVVDLLNQHGLMPSELFTILASMFLSIPVCVLLSKRTSTVINTMRKIGHRDSNQP
ncbi:hypothetical protein V6N11_079445 [Hibiscus sabdariffa]|uniref:Uncharacterized protein n=1 Tax=Hibiscus sabdariffa TaxID=183260 RepID=A0ABR2RW37_9ROSI